MNTNECILCKNKVSVAGFLGEQKHSFFYSCDKCKSNVSIEIQKKELVINESDQPYTNDMCCDGKIKDWSL